MWRRIPGFPEKKDKETQRWVTGGSPSAKIILCDVSASSMRTKRAHGASQEEGLTDLGHALVERDAA
jgi:hypothetical protein